MGSKSVIHIIKSSPGRSLIADSYHNKSFSYDKTRQGSGFEETRKLIVFCEIRRLAEDVDRHVLAVMRTETKELIKLGSVMKEDQSFETH